MYDLIVIGAGPAGTSAAIASARLGRRVLLLERGKFPRHKVCGEFVSAESLELLVDLLGSQHAGLVQTATRIPRVRIFLDHRALQSPIQPEAASIARWELDAALWDSAIRCGVEAKPQVAAQRVTGSGPFLVTTELGEFEARAVINASGRWSNLSDSSAARNGQPGRWIGLKAHFMEASPASSVDLYFFDGGYCGVQPVKLNTDGTPSRINACAMVRAEVARTLTDVFAQHPVLCERARHWQPLTAAVSVAPLTFHKPEPQRDGILMVGDAAGFVDPFVGDGISLALRSGALASQCLARFFSGELSLEAATHQYAASYRRRLAPVFRASCRIRQMLSIPRTLRRPIAAFLENSPAITRLMVRMTR